MNDIFVQRLRAAVRAAWLTVLIWAVWLTLAWLVWLVLMHTQPGWLLTLWGGGDLTWHTVHLIWLGAVAVLKGAMLIWMMGTICLSLWLRGLKRAG